MNVRHHSMLPEDIPECMELLRSHPIIGPRYEPVIEHLPEAWLRLLRCEACINALVYVDAGLRPLCCIGLSVIVREDFIKELKTPPHFWIGPEMIRRIARGESPVLTDKEVRQGNSGSGLSMVCWDAWVRPGYEVHGELSRSIVGIDESSQRDSGLAARSGHDPGD